MTRLTISPAGKLISCEIAGSAGLPSLDASACRMYAAGQRFEVRDVSEPVTVFAPVVWKLGD